MNFWTGLECIVSQCVFSNGYGWLVFCLKFSLKVCFSLFYPLLSPTCSHKKISKWLIELTIWLVDLCHKVCGTNSFWLITMKFQKCTFFVFAIVVIFVLFSLNSVQAVYYQLNLSILISLTLTEDWSEFRDEQAHFTNSAVLRVKFVFMLNLWMQYMSNCQAESGKMDLSGKTLYFFFKK